MSLNNSLNLIQEIKAKHIAMGAAGLVGVGLAAHHLGSAGLLGRGVQDTIHNTSAMIQGGKLGAQHAQFKYDMQHSLKDSNYVDRLKETYRGFKHGASDVKNNFNMITDIADRGRADILSNSIKDEASTNSEIDRINKENNLHTPHVNYDHSKNVNKVIGRDVDKLLSRSSLSDSGEQIVSRNLHSRYGFKSD